MKILCTLYLLSMLALAACGPSSTSQTAEVEENKPALQGAACASDRRVKPDTVVAWEKQMRQVLQQMGRKHVSSSDKYGYHFPAAFLSSFLQGIASAHVRVHFTLEEPTRKAATDFTWPGLLLVRVDTATCRDDTTQAAYYVSNRANLTGIEACAVSSIGYAEGMTYASNWKSYVLDNASNVARKAPSFQDTVFSYTMEEAPFQKLQNLGADSLQFIFVAANKEHPGAKKWRLDFLLEGTNDGVVQDDPAVYDFALPCPQSCEGQ